VRDMHGQQREPGRIVSSRLASMPGGDVAEFVRDSGGAWFWHWFSAGTRSWSPWEPMGDRHTEDVWVTGPYGGPGGPAALVTVVTWQPEQQSPAAKAIAATGPARAFFLLTADGLTPADL
jgi:hypothetical protein